MSKTTHDIETNNCTDPQIGMFDGSLPRMRSKTEREPIIRMAEAIGRKKRQERDKDDKTPAASTEKVA